MIKDKIHCFFTKEDFTTSEIKRLNPLATAVIQRNQKICKHCGYHKNVDRPLINCTEVEQERKFQRKLRAIRDRLEIANKISL